MPIDLEAVAKWHEDQEPLAINGQDAETAILHSRFAQMIRAAMSDIERLRKLSGQNHDLYNAAINEVVDLKAALKEARR